MDNGKIVMHKKGCQVAVDIASKQGDRIVDAEWTSQTIMSYLVHLQVEGIDRRGITLNVIQVISEQLNINIDKLIIETKKGLIRGYVSMYVSNIHDIQETVSLLKKIKGVSKVTRLESRDDYNSLEKQK